VSHTLCKAGIYLKVQSFSDLAVSIQMSPKWVVQVRTEAQLAQEIRVELWSKATKISA